MIYKYELKIRKDKELEEYTCKIESLQSDPAILLNNISNLVEAPVSPTEHKIMTKQEMLTALEYGMKVTHNYFDNNEYLELIKDGYYRFEDGNITTPARFWEFRTETYWETGWKIFGK